MIQTDTLKNGFKIIQDTERFQFGIDAVLLADFAAGSVHEGDKVIDLGTGTGIIPLLLAGRWKSTEGAFDTPLRGTQAPQVTFTGLEVQEASADMAAQSVALNGLEGQIQILQGDLKEADNLFPRHSFDVITMLEVLEHIPEVEQAVRAAVRMARQYIVITVPSKPDNNPEHIHLLTKEKLSQMFGAAGCTRLHFDGVEGHLFMVAVLKKTGS